MPRGRPPAKSREPSQVPQLDYQNDGLDPSNILTGWQQHIPTAHSQDSATKPLQSRSRSTSRSSHLPLIWHTLPSVPEEDGLLPNISDNSNLKLVCSPPPWALSPLSSSSVDNDFLNDLNENGKRVQARFNILYSR